MNSPPSPLASPRLPAVAAISLITVVLVAGLAARWSGADDGESTPGTSGASGRPAVVGEPVATVAVETVPKRRKTRIAENVSFGVVGDDVAMVQRRLKKLNFDPGPVDGSFGERTRAAVWGFEKLIMGVEAAQATGVVDQRLWSRMQDTISVEPRRRQDGANHTEVYLPEQIVIFFREGRAALISHMSSGDNEEWCDDVVISPGEYGNEDGEEPLRRRECGQSVTPGGVYRYERLIDGIRQSALGGMWNPIYFNYGIAIHGAQSVPLQPASHGCIRIPIDTSEWFHEIATVGDAVYVFDGVEEPEAYGAQLPVFNHIDPEWLATSTTSTTTPPTEATVPATDTTPSSTSVPPTEPPPPTTVATTPTTRPVSTTTSTRPPRPTTTTTLAPSTTTTTPVPATPVPATSPAPGG